MAHSARKVEFNFVSMLIGYRQEYPCQLSVG